MKLLRSSVILALLLVSFLGPLGIARANSQPSYRLLPARENKIDAALNTRLSSLQPGTMTTVIVQLRQRANLPDGRGLKRRDRLSRIIQSLKGTADGTQGPVKLFLKLRNKQGRVSDYSSFWVFNGFSVTADAATIQEIAALPDVYSVTPDGIDITTVSSADLALSNPEPNINLINAPSLWALGYTGQGTVIANVDSGVDLTHPELSARWRGGTNSWFDPFGQHPNSPIDLSGHGTWTMGVMLGGDAGGTSIGVAPGAQWIAARIFNDQGSSTATAIHQAYQWLLDPDNDPTTADAPDVVNNSWAFSAPGCNLEFEPDLQAMRAAGLLPVFAAGNYGPSASTSASPANNPSAFAVGAITNSNSIYSLSSRGPSTCGGSTGVFPELVAPGVNINTTDLNASYTIQSGTSLSAPHVAGGLALLLSAYPNLSASQQENALIASAADLGIAGPDDVYGYGRLDLLAAYQYIPSAPTETPSPLPTFTATATETATATLTDTPIPPTATSTPGPSDTGWQGPGAQAAISGGDGNGYEVSPTNAFASDGLFAVDNNSGTTTSTLCTDSGKDRHKFYNYNLVVPAGTMIQGIQVRLDAKVDSTVGAPKVCVSLSGDHGATWSAWKMTPTLETTLASYIVGGASDTWGNNWTADQLSSANFQIRVQDNASDITRDFSLDWIAVDVFFASSVTSTNTPVSPTAASTFTPMPTNTTPPPTASGTPTATVQPSDTPTSIPTNTATALASSTPTITPTSSPGSPLYFSTLGNTNPPGVSGTADDADIYFFDGSTFSRSLDASGTGSLLALPSGANVDGFDRVDATHFYLSFAGSVAVPGLGTVDDEDVVFYNAGTWSLFFDGSVNGLASTDLDAISIVGGKLYFSTDTNTLPPGVSGSADDADIYVWNGGSSYTRVVDASGSGSLGLASSADVDGLVRVDATHFYVSFNADTTVPGLGAVQDEDVAYYNGGTWSVYFDGTAKGLTASNLDLDAFDLP